MSPFRQTDTCVQSKAAVIFSSDPHLHDNKARRVARAAANRVSQPGVGVEGVKGTAGHPDGHNAQRQTRHLTRQGDEARADQAGVTSDDGVCEGTYDPEHGRRTHQDAQHGLGQSLGHGVGWSKGTEKSILRVNTEEREVEEEEQNTLN